MIGRGRLEGQTLRSMPENVTLISVLLRYAAAVDDDSVSKCEFRSSEMEEEALKASGIWLLSGF
jgi:hypothetical protein